MIHACFGGEVRLLADIVVIISKYSILFDDSLL